MKVFLSWSGTKSRAVAEALYAWLPQVIQAVDPFLSGEIDKGARWSNEVDGALEGTRFGILCLTNENLTSPWILYEAGALSKTKDAFIWTLLVGLNPADVEPPLSRFQHTIAEKSDLRRLLHTINRQVAQVGERSLKEQALDGIFEVFWPQLEQRISSAAQLGEKPSGSPRSDRQLLEEILEILRQQERAAPTTLTYRAIAYLAKFVEQALRDKDREISSDIRWVITSDIQGIYLRAERESDGTQCQISVPVKTDWPQGSSWSYAVEIADELKRKLRESLRNKKSRPKEAANPSPQADG
jgi:hypothetical protein